jgi:hypothetical protein
VSDIERPTAEDCAWGFYANCSACHSACNATDAPCNARCEDLPSCQGPQ